MIMSDKELKEAITQAENEDHEILKTWSILNQKRKDNATVPAGIYVRISDCKRVKVWENAHCGLTQKELVIFLQLWDQPLLWTMPVDVFKGAYLEEAAFLNRYLN